MTALPGRTPVLRALATAIGLYFNYQPYQQWRLPTAGMDSGAAKELADSVARNAGRLATVNDDYFLRAIANAVSLNKGNQVAEIIAMNEAQTKRLSPILDALRQSVNRYLAARARATLVGQGMSHVANDIFAALGAEEVGSLINAALVMGDSESTALQKLVAAANAA